MNRLIFNQSIGFPLETNILSEMQTAWSILNALGNIAGNFTILQGCTEVGTTVSDGVVFINGEVIEFKGGQVQSSVIIVQTPTVLEFEDNSEHEVIFTRYATFGVGTALFPWEDFKRFKTSIELTEEKAENTTIDALIERIEELEGRPAANVPVGLIAIWGQAANLIPDGWEEYAPLRGRMPVGLDTSDPYFETLLAPGGSKTHINTIAEMATHGHDWNYSTEGDDGATGGSYSEFTQKPGGIAANNSQNPIGKTGGGQEYSIMNPYRVVLYIQYVG